MTRVALSVVTDDLSRYVKLAGKEEGVITRHGRPAAILHGFASEDDSFEYRLQNDPRFLARVEKAKRNMKSGRGTRLEDVEWDKMG